MCYASAKLYSGKMLSMLQSIEVEVKDAGKKNLEEFKVIFSGTSEWTLINHRKWEINEATVNMF